MEENFWIVYVWAGIVVVGLVGLPSVRVGVALGGGFVQVPSQPLPFGSAIPDAFLASILSSPSVQQKQYKNVVSILLSQRYICTRKLPDAYGRSSVRVKS